MRALRISLCVLIVSLALLVVTSADEKPWFDMENCAFCKNLKAEEGLMDNITKWEHHNVKNGTVSITVVNKEYLPAYKRAMDGMEKTSQRMEAGEQLPMCGMCEAYGAAMMKGAQWDEIQSGNTFVSIMYSSEPEVISEIHALTDRTNQEMEKMMEMEKAGEMKKMEMEEGHEGHDHK